ncbi:MAG: hypothetical protein R3F29_13925 [Planctomycetota bacterium]
MKTPGDGYRYAVGSALVANTNPFFLPTPKFSDHVCKVPLGIVPVTAGRQIAILQITNEDGITQHQAYFYGQTPNQTSGGLSTFARAVAVQPGANAQDTRVVICGETFDEKLDLSATADCYFNLYPHGFVAVFDGEATLLWTYQFYGQDPTALTAITDVAIHYDSAANEDVVTFCGITTDGNYAASPANPSTMAPKKWFDAPSSGPSGSGCNDPYSGGDVANSLLTQTRWDGMVGRLTCSHTPSTSPQVDKTFLSLVGGSQSELLFGIAELDYDHFAVVGTIDATNPWPGGYVCPLTRPWFKEPAPATPPTPTCLQSTTSRFGLLMVFDAAGVSPPTGKLQLECATLIGNDGSHTSAADVVNHRDRLFVVGTTDDPLLASDVGNGSDQAFAIGSSHQGFVVSTTDATAGFDMATFYAPTGDTALTSVAAWRDYADHVAVGGWVKKGPQTGDRDVAVASLFVDSTVTPPQLTVVRDHVITTLDQELPGPNPSGPATASFGQSYDAPWGPVDGGGLAVNPRGQVSIVGSTSGTNYDFPYTIGKPGRQRQPDLTTETDAFLTVLDMLPEGVCRTDGTGWPGLWTIAAGYDGGTTPVCALSPPDSMPRTFIDYLGDPPAQGVVSAILLDRPPGISPVQGGVLQFGFPNSSPVPGNPLGAGVELWTSDPGAVLVAFAGNNSSLKHVLPPFPVGPNSFTMQFLFLLGTPVCSNIDWAASPAILISY